ncbi:sulfotransferase domain-containing protein [Rossellomorea vietnamensis]|uniref:Sulfotransferase domain-containing protein n=1 Tax=Rossellomorea vietnamensis TaxID=218284 RepID=A0A0P6WN28_9BACI|nr:sulfotransferase domain-containing protein [Rossellomorea vietnamensis]KPL57621.1 hypothetical protein AM506_21255 [Rossellomorea vietnamensis]
MNANSKIIINTIPKSGTHLLLQLILGYMNKTEYRWILKEEEINDIKPGEVILSHLEYSDNAHRMMIDNNITMIFGYRDLRDISVSLVHFIVKNQYNHPMNPYLTQHFPSHDQRLLAIIKGAKENPANPNSPYVIPPIDYYAKNKIQWLKAKDVCHVSFEDLRVSEKSLDKSLKRIIEFLNEGQTNQTFLDTKINQMKKNINHSKSDTFRKGVIGDWKKEFNEHHKKAFKQIANGLLVQFGYESDDQW